mmetsp:Transcript_48597/g.59771  ORF Transcript_48597/g.59771 Transcript_48597/m.59771 type:complete len:351 (-) Transcript_48597:71-1123(-)
MAIMFGVVGLFVILNIICDGSILDDHLYGSCYSDNADVPNSIIEISSPNTLYVDEIFPNSDVDTIFCLWYTNREAAHRAADEEITSKEIKLQIKSDGIMTTNIKDMELTCDGISIDIFPSTNGIESSHLCASQCKVDICHKFLSQRSSINSNDNDMNIPSWLIPVGCVIIGILLIIVLISFIIFIRTRSRKTLNEAESKMYIEKTMNDVIDDIAKYTIGDLDDDLDDDLDTNDWNDSTSSPIQLGRHNSSININNNITIDSDNDTNNNDDSGCNSIINDNNVTITSNNIKSHTLIPKLDTSKIQMSVSSSDDDNNTTNNINDKQYFSDDLNQVNTLIDDDSVNDGTNDLP